ncbi:hypothetical protein [Nioella sediminis]|jgi:hypothetical protein|uniref:hypothetical protein n=1 Tax=Nioella sediminis TaxID=1912092 RepID=UPI0008FD79EF|nr:hypothetical protein [Nioella sediminis]TBX28182.1 membrane protein [Roseovarius sp. JS7-11]
MPNALASLALVIYPVVVVWLFVRLPRGRALLASLILGYLFLPPEPAGFDFPLMPPLTKQTIPGLAALFTCLVMFRGELRFLPENNTARALVLLFIFSPFGTVLTNMDPVYFDSFTLPPLRIREAVAQCINQALLISPLLLARDFLRSDEDIRDLLWAMLLAGLVYSLPMLLEVRLSPQLNIWIYGYFQHSFEQMIRGDGFRPIVFLYHGLWAAFLALTALLSAITIARSDRSRRALLWWAAAAYMGLVLILCKSMASILYAAAFAPVLLFLGSRMQFRVAMLLACLVLAYPALKSFHLIPEADILELAESVDEDRANSLRFRLDNENILIDRAMERPVFGWGTWGRNQIYDGATGEILTTTDGRWIITIGVYGWAGFLAEFGLLTLPIFLVWWRVAAFGREVPPWVGGAVLILAINVIDMIPNATLTPMSFLFAGALLGYSEQVQTARRRKVLTPLRTVL